MRALVRNLPVFISIFTFGGITYSSLEVAYRGSSHWTMTITGGLCFFMLYMIAIYIKASFWKKAAFGAFLITCTEFVVGIIVNKVLGWEIWDYSDLPFNFMGQICLGFTIMWVGLSVVSIWLCKYIFLLKRRSEQKAFYSNFHLDMPG